MKHILAPILLLVFLFPTLALSEEVTMDDLVERDDGLYYKKFTDVLFSGKVMGKEQGGFKEGKREGPWVAYYEDGQLREKGDYKNGEKISSWVSYYFNGQLGEKGDYKNGKRDGAWVSYYQNSQLDWKGDYKNGQRNGQWISYNKDGTLDQEYTGTYKNGVKVEPFPLVEEVILEELIERDGIYYKKFNDVPFTGTSRTDQQLRTYKDGKLEGLSIDYYPSGQIAMIVYFKDGKHVGPFVTYHKNGQVYAKGENNESGRKEGLWVFYWLDGSVMEDTGYYEDGRKVD